MAERDDDILDRYYGGRQPTTADILQNMPYEGAGNDFALKAYLRDQHARTGKKGSPELNAALERDKPSEPNWLSTAMSYALPTKEAEFVANFLTGKNLQLPPRKLNRVGTYSAVREAIDNIGIKSGTPEQLLNAIAKQPNVKNEELYWMGLADIVNGKPVPTPGLQYLASGNKGRVITRDDMAKLAERNEVRPQQVELNEYGDMPDISQQRMWEAAEANADQFQVRPNWEVYEDRFSPELSYADRKAKATKLAEESDNYVVVDSSDDPVSDRRGGRGRGLQLSRERAEERADSLNERARDEAYQNLDPRDFGDGQPKHLNYIEDRPGGRNAGEDYREIVDTIPEEVTRRRGQGSAEGTHYDEYGPNVINSRLVHDYTDAATGQKGTFLNEGQGDITKARAKHGLQKTPEEIEQLAIASDNAKAESDRVARLGFNIDAVNEYYKTPTPEAWGAVKDYSSTLREFERDREAAQRHIDRAKKIETDPERYRVLVAPFEREIQQARDRVEEARTRMRAAGATGFENQREYDAWDDARSQADLRATEARNAAYAARQGVPDVPLTDKSGNTNWMMKQSLIDAARSGSDWLGWSPPELIKDRWPNANLEETYKKHIPDTVRKLVAEHAGAKPDIENFYIGDYSESPGKHWKQEAMIPRDQPMLPWDPDTSHLPHRNWLHGSDVGVYAGTRPADVVMSPEGNHTQTQGLEAARARYNLVGEKGEYIGGQFRTRETAEEAMRDLQHKFDNNLRRPVSEIMDENDDMMKVPGVRLTPEVRDSIKKRGFSTFDPMFAPGAALGVGAAGQYLDSVLGDKKANIGWEPTGSLGDQPAQYWSGGRIGFDEGGDTRIGQGYTAPETLVPLPRRPPGDPTMDKWTPAERPVPELRDPDQMRPDAYLDSRVRGDVGPWNALPAMFELGHKAHEIYDMAHEGEWMPAAKEFAQTALPMVAGAVVPMAPKTTRMGIEEYVQGLKKSPTAQHNVVNFDKILDTDQNVPPSISRMQTSEPHYQQDKRNLQLRKNQPQALQDATSRGSVNNMVRLADQGLYTGLDGRLVNPWYHPGALYDTFIRELGDELGADRFQKFMGFLASTSPMTGVERNTIEALHGLHNYINDIPMSKLDTSHLTGGAYNNKVNMLGDVASGEGLTSKGGPKVRNFWLNLMGAGYMPEYEFANGRAKLIQPPSTLDNIMMQAFGYMDAEGKPKRPVGPPYRVMQDVLHQIAQKFDATDPDTQAAIWQAFQRAKDREKGPYASSGTAYNMPFAGTFNEVINRIGRERDQHPSKVLENMLTGREPPPNFFTVKEDGGRVGMYEGGVPPEWQTEVEATNWQPDVKPTNDIADYWANQDKVDAQNKLDEQMEYAPRLKYPLATTGYDWTGVLAPGVDQRWLNHSAVPDVDAYQDALRADQGTSEYDRWNRAVLAAPMIGGGFGQFWKGPGKRESENAYFAPEPTLGEQWTLSTYNQPLPRIEVGRASGGDVDAPEQGWLNIADKYARLDRPDDVTTSDMIGAMPYEGAGNSFAIGARLRDEAMRTGKKLSPELNAAVERYPPPTFNWFGDLMNAIPPEIALTAMFLGPSGASRVGRTTGWGSPQALTEAQARWGKEPLSKTWQETGWAPHDTFGTDPAAHYKGEPMTWHPSKNLSIKEDQLRRWVHNDVVGQRANDKLPNLIELGDLGLAEPSLLNMTADVTLDPAAAFGTGSTGRRLIYEGGVKRIGAKPVGEVAPYMNLTGGNLDELRALLPHEMQHAIAAGQRLTPTGDGGQLMKPILGTQAERMLQEHVTDLMRRYDDSVAKRGPANPYSVQLFGELQQVRRQLDMAPGYAGYLNGPDERLAREAFIRSRLPEEQQPYFTPGQIDTYAPGVMGERLEATHLVPMKAYEPGRAEGGEVDGYGEGGTPTNLSWMDALRDPNSIRPVEHAAPDPYWTAPYQPPSTGELRAPAARPADWSEPIAQQLSPTMGAYDTMQLGLDAYHDWKEGDYRELGYKAPMVGGMLIGMPGAGKLAKMKSPGLARHPDDWGGVNRGVEAANHLDRGLFSNMSPEEVWSQLGWEDRHAFGKGPYKDQSPRSQMHTIIPVPEFQINERLRNLIRDNPDDPFESLRPVKTMYEGLDQVLGATPRLADKPVHLRYSPANGNDYAGAAHGTALYPGKTSHESLELERQGVDPGNWRINNFDISAPTLDDLNSVSQHEVLGHGGQMAHRAPWPGVVQPEKTKVHGTDAEAYFAAQMPILRQQRNDAHAAGDYNLALKLDRKLIQARTMLNNSPGHAGYLATPWEDAARALQMIGRSGEDDIRKTMPSQMNTYDTWLDPKMEELVGIPLSAFKPKAVGGGIAKLKPEDNRDQDQRAYDYLENLFRQEDPTWTPESMHDYHDMGIPLLEEQDRQRSTYPPKRTKRPINFAPGGSAILDFEPDKTGWWFDEMPNYEQFNGVIGTNRPDEEPDASRSQAYDADKIPQMLERDIQLKTPKTR